jgi:hypothetical protein
MAARRRSPLSTWFLVTFALAVATILFGYFGFRALHREPPVERADQDVTEAAESLASPEEPAAGDDPEASISIVEALLRACGLPIVSSTYSLDAGPQRIPWQLNLARGLGLAFAFSAILLVAIHAGWRIVNIVTLWFWKRGEDRFVVVCGLGWTGREIVLDLLGRQGGARPDRRKRRQRVVVIDADDHNPFLDSIGNRDVIKLVDDAATTRALRCAAVTHAKAAYIVTGSDETNCRIASQIHNLCREAHVQHGKKCSPTLYVHVAHTTRRRGCCCGSIQSTAVSRGRLGPSTSSSSATRRWRRRSCSRCCGSDISGGIETRRSISR